MIRTLVKDSFLIELNQFGEPVTSYTLAAFSSEGNAPALRLNVILSSGFKFQTAGGAAFGVTRLIRQMLFGVGPADLATFVGVGLFVLLVALVACLIPVWRAVRVDPSVALRAM